MRASKTLTALLLTAFAAGVQAQAADATAKDKVAAASAATKAAAVQAPAKSEPCLNHEGPFSVFTYEAVGATPRIQLGRAKAPAAQTETVAAARK